MAATATSRSSREVEESIDMKYTKCKPFPYFFAQSSSSCAKQLETEEQSGIFLPQQYLHSSIIAYYNILVEWELFTHLMQCIMHFTTGNFDLLSDGQQNPEIDHNLLDCLWYILCLRYHLYLYERLFLY
ncbi:unnamed protein product [Onchocerca flexuosa]|uniref:Ovule protein n=1 Tax=Onchocerca flexuosa TaxID=387005 RepID=A0A183H1B2_9BILA|nr:unnamed protein product [Onchocerca flexuosa]